jgi:hypothetical protein
MTNGTAFQVNRDSSGNHLKPNLNLPGPRIWKPKHLADFLGVSIHWVYKRTEAAADDPIPRIPGVGRLSFDTRSPAFQDWIGRQLGCVDIGESDA